MKEEIDAENNKLQDKVLKDLEAFLRNNPNATIKDLKKLAEENIKIAEERLS